MTSLEEQHIPPGKPISIYRTDPRLTSVVTEMAEAADMMTTAFRGYYRNRRLYSISSTAKGGGVAEMLPCQMQMIRQFGVEAHWLVISPDVADLSFFQFTKRLHNLLHDNPKGPSIEVTEEERRVYCRVTQEAAMKLAPKLCPGDVVILHDPQTLGMAPHIRSSTEDVILVYRSHIGVDKSTPATKTAWKFLKPFAKLVNSAVFSAAEYIPGFLAGKSTVISPGIDPTDAKNMELSATKLTRILVQAGMVSQKVHCSCYPAWEHGALRLHTDGSLRPFLESNDFEFMFRPIISQISRWDRLKGFLPLMQGFVLLKKRRQWFVEKSNDARLADKFHGCRLDHVGLVLAGPAPMSIQDDPEGQQVFEELRREYLKLDPEIQADIAVVTLPMGSRKQNALMVNALHSCSDIVVQNSLQEGFGLTCAEAMLKGVAVVGTSACGLRKQIIQGVHGLLVRDPNNEEEIATVLNRLLSNEKLCLSLGAKAQRRVIKEFTMFAQLTHWLELFNKLLGENRLAEADMDADMTIFDEDDQARYYSS